MEEKKKNFWGSLEEHPIRTIIVVSLLCDAAVGIAKSVFRS
jgi:hypothetical protein